MRRCRSSGRESIRPRCHPAPPGAPRIAPRNRGSDTDTSPTSSVYPPPACAGVSETPGRSCILDTSVPSRPRSAPPRRLVSHQPRASILTGSLAHPSTKGAHLSPVDFRQLLPPASVVSFDAQSRVPSVFHSRCSEKTRIPIKTGNTPKYSRYVGKPRFSCSTGGRTRPCGVDRHPFEPRVIPSCAADPICNLIRSFLTHRAGCVSKDASGCLAQTRTVRTTT